mgnify:CR=1 FL=1
MDEFKEFLKTVPSVKQDVLNGRYTWQQLYEIYVMYQDQLYDTEQTVTVK